MIIENYPSTYHGYPFITLIQFNSQHLLTIVDNYDRKTIKAYVLDYCSTEGVDELSVISNAENWYNSGEPLHPISVEFSRVLFVSEASKIYRTFSVDSVTRVIGPIYSFDMDSVFKVKRKRKVTPDKVIMFPSISNSSRM